MQSYLVKGARSKRSSMRSSNFQPLTLLNMVVYHREKNELQHIREVEVAEPFHSISSHLLKSMIAIFLSELLLKSVKEGEADAEMFEFLASSLHLFDMQEDGIENFHLYLLIKLSRYLGFYPQGKPERDESYFDLREGKFSGHRPAHPDHLDPPQSRNMYALSLIGAGELEKVVLNYDSRSQLLSALLIYYQIHLSGLGNIKSYEVLKEVLR